MQIEIIPDLLPLAFPVAKLKPLPGNPRRGDVAAVRRSYETFGQRKPIVARRVDGGEGIVTAGNHQLLAALEMESETIAVAWTDDDDATAAAFALADNHTADLGSYDEDDLLAMMQAVAAADGDLFDATAYTDKDIERMLKAMDPDTSSQIGVTEYRLVILCDDEAHQA